MAFDFDTVFAAQPVLLAPMEDVTDAVFRRVCRARGASLCVTEFVLAEDLIEGEADARGKIALDTDEAQTAIQIYGADAERLAQAASFAEQAAPAYIDINCGCWVPKVARRGAGAAWLREPSAMVAMARMVVSRVALPVTVKTRIGWGDEAELPIVELARRLEDAGVRALTVHCRTARMGHSGAADWRWAERAQAAVRIPVIVNGDIRSANDAKRALDQTGCAGVMIGRRAIEHPWVFREVHARMAHAPKPSAPTWAERVALCREHLLLRAQAQGARRALHTLSKLYAGYLGKRPQLGAWLDELKGVSSLEEALEVLTSLEHEQDEEASRQGAYLQD
jgi:tRNA-dihydrouridine synthase B